MTIENSLDHLDLEGDAKVTATPEVQAKVAKLIADWDAAKERLASLSKQTAALNATINDLEVLHIPAAMMEAGLTSFKTTTGRVVEVKDTVNANIPAVSTIEKAKGPERTTLLQRRANAFAYLREHAPGLIKTEVTVALPAGELGVASQIAGLIRDQFGYSADTAETVHPQTLTSHFKELLSEGKIGEIPTEPFNLYVGPRAKIK